MGIKIIRTVIITSFVTLGFSMSIGFLEIIIFQLGAIILGFSIHFFWSNRNSLKRKFSPPVEEERINEADDWRLQYYEQLDLHEKLNHQMREDLAEAKQHAKVLSIEVEELKNELSWLRQEAKLTEEKTRPGEYLSQLQMAREDLSEHNEKVGRLVEQVDVLKIAETKQQETLKLNETLNLQIRELRKALMEKEEAFKHSGKYQALAHEMKDRLDKAYADFNLLQDKLQKLELQLSKPQSRNYEYEELQQSYFKLTKEFDELKLKQLSMIEEHQRVSRILSDTEDKLRESNFQRQQLLKKVNFLDELTDDLQQVTTYNKKLESQLRRIGEIESLLAGLSDFKKDDTGH